MNPNKHGNRSYSFSVKTNNNNQFLNQANAARKTELIYMNKPYNLNTVFYQNKNDISRENNQGRKLQSRYSSASENKYHFMHKLASNPQIIFLLIKRREKLKKIKWCISLLQMRVKV